MRIFRYFLASFVLVLSAPVWCEGVVVIVHKDNASQVDLAYVSRIYSGSLKGWPDGSPVFSLDHPEESEVRVAFTTQVLNRSVANMRALWSQNIFTGKAHPPRVVSPDAEMKRLVSSNKNAIGYIRASQVDGTVRVIEK